jgi:uncharacterized protein (TIGR02271 family)
MNETSKELCALSDADFEVAPGEHDVRGWDVVLGSNDDEIGQVEDLIIDPAAGKVRYLVVDLDHDTLSLERDRKVLVPIASAQLDIDEEQVVLGGMARPALLSLPEYDGRMFSHDYDESFRSRLRDQPQSTRVTRSAEELRIGKRMEKQGEVRVSKHVETDHVRETVPLHHEEVRIERRPVEEHAVGSSAEMRSDEIVIPVMGEEAVVEKRPVVKEEIVVSKVPVTTRETVETDVRREEFDVERSGGNVRVNEDVKGRGGE